ncbi:MAG: hypothetical protein KDB24_18010 [Microthrixaceae bacterium]|nr:hypothetical protein [Microthrixaceae bacterium]
MSEQLNIHGRALRAWYEERQPEALAAMDNPMGFLEAQGELIEDQIVTLEREFYPPSKERNEMPFLERVGALNAARDRAREVVYAEWMPLG